MGLAAELFWEEIIDEALSMVEDIYSGVVNNGQASLAEMAIEACEDYTGYSVEGHDFDPGDFYGSGVSAHDNMEDALGETIWWVGQDIADFIDYAEDIFSEIDAIDPS